MSQTLDPAASAAAAAAAASASAAAVAAQVAGIKSYATISLIGPVTIAGFMGCTMCGGVIALAALYALQYPRDRWMFKALVGFLTIFTIWDTAVEAAWVWHWAVDAFVDIYVLVDVTPVHFSLSSMNIAITELVVQSFFIWRVWVISNRKSMVLCGVQVAFMLLAVASLLFLSAQGYMSDTNEAISVFRPIAILRVAAGVFADCLITASLTYYIIVKPRAIGMPVYSSNLQRIVSQAFTTNLATTVLQITTLVLIAADKLTCRYLISSFMEVKVMVMCLFASLLSRAPTSSGYSQSGEPSNTGGFLSNNNNNKHLSRSRPNHGNSVRVDIDTHVNVDEDLDLESDGFGSPARTPGGAGATSPYRVTFNGGRDVSEKSYNEKAASGEEVELKAF